ncbi:MAG: ATP-dependent DNA helicase [Candidatus Peregrinibacteria bacterium]|nr:ATP-dependent DNA helicase [Candidatus Peregrinibacteria bacterium]
MDLEEYFQQRYKGLNGEQKKAVDTIEGPVMVIAGPGSGKTELLSLRVANILRLTDTLPSSILCLTYTDAGATTMRKRLAGLIGLDAYKVAIHTFHGFGTEIINKNPEYFYQGGRYSPADDLTRYAILEKILEHLKYDSSLRSYHPDQGYTYLKDIISKIGELKKGGLSPENFKEILEENKSFLEQANSFLEPVFQKTIVAKTIGLIPELIENLKGVTFQPRTTALPYLSIKDTLVTSLENAYEEAMAEDKPNTKPITAWKNEHTKKNDEKINTFKDIERIKKQFELCDVYAQYQQQLHKEGFFDYDDMLLDTVEALMHHPELKYNLQERYLYVLVDEFQDTNGVQMRLLDLLLDNDVHEGRPNVLAVGDDDQAIYKFQGANMANLMEFHKKYRDPTMVVLQQNYRSTRPILDFVRQVILKGEERLENQLPDLIKKELYSANTSLVAGEIIEKEFPTSLEEMVWVSEIIQKKLTEKKTSPSAIAVIARKHETLERAAKVLDYFGIPVSYERKKNLLEQKHIKELITILKFVDTVATNERQADEYLPEILSAPFWNIDRVTVWKLSAKSYEERKSWLKVMLESEDQRLKQIATFLITLGVDAKEKTAEEIIDMITGVDDSETAFQSPYKAYYFNPKAFEEDRLAYLNLLQALQALIEKVRSYKGSGAKTVSDVVELITLHEKHQLRLYYTSAFNSDEKAVNLLTAHGAKGLEFEHVFLLHCHDAEWTRSHSADKLTLPSNIPLAAEGETDDDKLRLFYVALTRAKRNLYLTRHQYKENGNEQIRLRFLEDGMVEKRKKENIDPATVEGMQHDFAQAKGLEKLLLLQLKIEKHEVKNIEEDEVLKGLLKDYQLSVTHLNNFLDVTKGGPQTFLEQNLLRFPQRPILSGTYGSAMHHALSTLAGEFKLTNILPSLDFLLKEFERYLSQQRLSKKDFAECLEKGRDHLSAYYEARKAYFNPQDQSEYDFRGQSVVIENAELTGKIDKWSYDEEKREILVYDYKTGHPLKDWTHGSDYEKIKAWKYKNQLIFYKILVENARDLRSKFTVRQGFLEFLEPVDGKINILSLDITDEETERMKKLIVAVYSRIMALDFPDVSGYERSLEGVREFEEGLLKSS